MAAIPQGIIDRAIKGTDVLAEMLPVRAAFLFGSQAEGRADGSSDIDLAAFVEGVEDWDIQKRARAMGRVQREAGLDVEAHLFPASALDTAEKGTFARYVQDHGVQIVGEGKAIS